MRVKLVVKTLSNPRLSQSYHPRFHFLGEGLTKKGQKDDSVYITIDGLHDKDVRAAKRRRDSNIKLKMWRNESDSDHLDCKTLIAEHKYDPKDRNRGTITYHGDEGPSESSKKHRLLMNHIPGKSYMDCTWKMEVEGRWEPGFFHRDPDPPARKAIPIVFWCEENPRGHTFSLVEPDGSDSLPQLVWENWGYKNTHTVRSALVVERDMALEVLRVRLLAWIATIWMTDQLNWVHPDDFKGYEPVKLVNILVQKPDYDNVI
ncbi:hypothetical protein VFPPC_02574 [Pochonia chlamydosporia 170]|uniref:Uncharacterized protein n=1 Tax=Pochonia chlamydosporia 170 TaxID=1380566 RepID=A0A179FXD6_METCM|nr:hypothetical protein VFPPC_02574 [Pochonia chlamydosporia 170]OAQ70037.1 hypothetical protein VFPPC_02574 [Pochonia chlamydosporia 170]